MFCIECGHQLPDSAKFCQRCGRSQSMGAQGSTTQLASPTLTSAPMEIAEVEYRAEIMNMKGWLSGQIGLGEQTKGRFVARAFGQSGDCIAGEIAFEAYGGNLPLEVAMGTQREGAQRALDYLTTQLRAEGWRQMPSGANWYNLRFTREIPVGPGDVMLSSKPLLSENTRDDHIKRGNNLAILVVMLALIFFYPIGVIFMWAWMRNWPSLLKVLITTLPIGIFVIAYLSAAVIL